LKLPLSSQKKNPLTVAMLKIVKKNAALKLLKFLVGENLFNIFGRRIIKNNNIMIMSRKMIITSFMDKISLFLYK